MCQLFSLSGLWLPASERCLCGTVCCDLSQESSLIGSLEIGCVSKQPRQGQTEERVLVMDQSHTANTTTASVYTYTVHTCLHTVYIHVHERSVTETRQSKATTPVDNSLFPKRKRRAASGGTRTHDVLHTRQMFYMYMRKGLGIFLENREKPAATRD